MDDLDRVPALAEAFMRMRGLSRDLDGERYALMYGMVMGALHAYLSGELDEWLANSNKPKES